MKFLLTLLVFSCYIHLYAQIGKSKDSDIIYNNGITHQLSFTKAPKSKKYLSGKTIYDKFGRNILTLEFDKKGDTTEIIKTEFEGDSIEHTTYFENQLTDTAIFKYDNKGRLSYEYWYWGDEKNSDESHCFYVDSLSRASYKINKFPWHTFKDTFYYDNDKLIRKETYNSDGKLEQLISYLYKNNKLDIEASYIYKSKERLDYRTTYSYDKKGCLAAKTTKYHLTNYKVKKIYKCYKNGQLKAINTTQYLISKFLESSTHKYTKEGLLKKSVFIDEKGKKQKIRKKYFGV